MIGNVFRLEDGLKENFYENFLQGYDENAPFL